MIHNSTNFTDAPTAFVTVNRNRVKTYDNKVYLKDGTQFEIELWNPNKTRVLASISIDGKDISEKGIVLNPGQRVSIERWVDDKSPRKFKFTTYSVENSQAAMNAISNNGRVKVSFYDEILKNFYPNGSSFGTVVTTTPTWDHPYYYNINEVNPNITLGGSTVNNTFNLTNDSAGVFYSNTSYSSNIGAQGLQGPPGPAGIEGAKGSIRSATPEIETGIVGEGDVSKQSFVETTGDFNSWPAKIWEWQILPESTRPLDAEKIRSYCTDCGTRVRATSWKYCPSCGEKLN